MTVYWNDFVGALDTEYGSAHSVQKHSLSSSFSDDSFLWTPHLGCLDFRDFSWLPLNNLLRLACLLCSFTVCSDAVCTAVTFKVALPLDFLLRVSFVSVLVGKAWCQPDLAMLFCCQSRGYCVSAGCWRVRVLTNEFEVETSRTVHFCLLFWRGLSDTAEGKKSSSLNILN